jgi:hypothetical protein
MHIIAYHLQIISHEQHLVLANQQSHESPPQRPPQLHTYRILGACSVQLGLLSRLLAQEETETIRSRIGSTLLHVRVCNQVVRGCS